MKVLLIISHGSRRKESNDEVLRLCERIANKPGPAIEKVCSAFLELASPGIDSAIADLADEGATEIVIFPYFLAAGTHVVKDIPLIIDGERKKYPHICFNIVPHLGAIQGISSLILDHIDLSEN